MKNIIIIALISFYININAQVSIGKSTVENNSVSLSFGNYTTVTPVGKGIILPWVIQQDQVTDAEKGTLIFDSTDKKVKYKKHDGSWISLTKNEDSRIAGTLHNTTGTVDTSLQDFFEGAPIEEKKLAKASIGIPTNTPGILVLENTNQAMVLPKVPNVHLTIKNPEPGTIAYDTVSKQFAVFNGTVWSFWSIE